VGLIRELVLLPVAPLRFTVWVADQVADEADRQQYSTGAGVQQIDEVEQARERGELSEEEADERQGEIIEQQVGGSPSTAARDEEAQGG
jgi:Gas vesicle protein G